MPLPAECRVLYHILYVAVFFVYEIKQVIYFDWLLSSDPYMNSPYRRPVIGTVSTTFY